MKIFIAFTFLSVIGFSAHASECETLFPEANELYECVSVDPQTSIVTESHRIIYIHQLACLNKKESTIEFILKDPWMYRDDVKLISESENGFKGYKSEAVYPSGNIMKRYSKTLAIDLEQDREETIVMKYRSFDKHPFRKDELRGTGNYVCTKL